MVTSSYIPTSNVWGFQSVHFVSNKYLLFSTFNYNLILTLFFSNQLANFFHNLTIHSHGLVWASPAYHCIQPSTKNPTVLLFSQFHFFLLTRVILNRFGFPSYILPIENRNRRSQVFFSSGMKIFNSGESQGFQLYQALWAEQSVSLLHLCWETKIKPRMCLPDTQMYLLDGLSNGCFNRANSCGLFQHNLM